MSRNDIENMSAEERIALMEELWASFDRDDLEYPVPAWHKEVLEERVNSNSFIPFDKAKEQLREALDAYKNS